MDRHDIGGLRDHAAIAHLDSHTAAAQRALYGRRLAPLAYRGARLKVEFSEVTASHAQMQWLVRCDGAEFDVHFVNPGALFDIGHALSSCVPLALQRAAVLHAASELLDALEHRLGLPIELIGLNADAPLPHADTALGLKIALLNSDAQAEVGADADSPPPSRCAVVLRALTAEGWHRLTRISPGLPTRQPSHDMMLDVSLQLPPVRLEANLLRTLEAGDMLVLQASAQALARREVSLHIGGQLLGGVRATLTDGRMRIIQAAPTAHDVPHSPWSTPTVNPNVNSTEHSLQTSAPGGPPEAIDAAAVEGASPIDALHVEIACEIGRLSLSLSAVRSLAVGQVFDTQRGIDADSVVLWCGSQRLGVGRLVTIGERLAVRVTGLHSGHAPASDDAAPC